MLLLSRKLGRRVSVVSRADFPFAAFVAQVVAPTISNPSCQEQLIDAAREVSEAVDGCVESSQLATSDGSILAALGAAATNVGQALNDLINHIKRVF